MPAIADTCRPPTRSRGRNWRPWSHRRLELLTESAAELRGQVYDKEVAGFTLGGGNGYLARKHGLASDNLLAADVVTAAGHLLRASESENSDLFWALRGGSGNFGIVTAFEFQLHELDPQVLAGQIIHPFESARDVLRLYRAFMAEAPDEVQCYAFLIRIPPLPVFPHQYHGRVAVDLVAAYLGDIAEGEKILAPLRRFGRPILDGVVPQAYKTLQQTFDAGVPVGNRWYSKAHYFNDLTDPAIDQILDQVEQLPGEFTMVYLDAPGGAASRVDPAATAFPHRDAAFGLHILPGWSEPAQDDPMIEWARGFHRLMAPYASGWAYVNLLGGDEKDGPRSAYGSNLARLAEIKRKYDPENLLRMNHNIAPRR